MKISEIRAVVDSHFTTKALVAVFVGGTQGIGAYTAQTLAGICGTHNIPLRAYIVGRAQAKADAVIAKCSKLCPLGGFVFVQAKDLTTIIDVDLVSKRIQDLEQIEHGNDNPRIDLLCLTQGQVLFGPRQGLDRSMSLLYYSRIRFILNLMPLMEAAERPHVVSVYAAGMEATLYENDLSLRDPKHYSFANCRSHVNYMKTMTFEYLAQQHPKLGLTHIFPGLVLGPGFEDDNFPWWFKIAWAFAKHIAPFFATKSNDAGYTMLLCATEVCPAKQTQLVTSESDIKQHQGTDGVVGGGAYALGAACEVIPLKMDYKKLRDGAFQAKVWAHTQSALDDILKTGKFTG